jgi:hypothetical protein
MMTQKIKAGDTVRNALKTQWLPVKELNILAGKKQVWE